MEEDKNKKCNQHQGRQFLSEPFLFLVFTLIFFFTPDIYIASKYRLSVYLVCNNLHLSLLLLLACTYLNNAWDLVLGALPLYVCFFKINRFMYSPTVSRFG